MLANLANKAKMAIWAAKIKAFVNKPPGSDEGMSPESIESDGRASFAKCSTWTIICEEILDTRFARVYFERAKEELRRRGISDEEIVEMRRFAWLTAGWLNFDRCHWEWVNLDEKDIYWAIEWQYSDGYISSDERDRRIEYARKYDKSYQPPSTFPSS